MFQFHDGTIKSLFNNWLNTEFIEFQFHDGTIKRKMDWGTLGMQAGFNSTMVQLKECQSGSNLIRVWCFNSTMVQLKGSPTSELRTCEMSFNSTMVQLKEGEPPYRLIRVRSFNSTMVQLKDCILIMIYAVNYLFQFHDGTIKSLLQQCCKNVSF